jgi:hypothetical protein
VPATPEEGVGAEYCVASCDLGIFVEEAAEPVSSDDLDVGVDRIGQRPQRAGLIQGPVLKWVSYSARTVRRWRSFMMRIRSRSSRRTLPTLCRAKTHRSVLAWGFT